MGGFNKFNPDLQAIDLNQAAAEKVQVIDLNQAVAEKIEAIDLNQAVAEKIEAIDLNQAAAEKIQAIDLNQAAAEKIQAIDLNQAAAEKIQEIDLNPAAGAKVQPIDVSAAVADKVQPIDLNQAVADKVQPIDLSGAVAEGLAPLIGAGGALQLNARGKRVQDLQAKLVDLGLQIPSGERDEGRYGPGTQDAVRQLQARARLPVTGRVDDATTGAVTAAGGGAEGPDNAVEGRILLDRGVPAAGLTLRFYHKGFGADERRLGGDVVTDADGYYSATYPPGGASVNLEVRAVDGDGVEVPISTTRFGANRQEVLNLVAPGAVRTLSAELTRLNEDLSPLVGDVKDLGQAREDDERRDLSLLHNRTGWNAKIIGLAATAQTVSADTTVPADGLYALFRAGLPTDPQQLAQVSPDAVEKGLLAARAAGIVELDDGHVTAFKEAFTAFAQETQRTTKAPGAVSTLGELLASSTLSDDEQRTFQDLQATHRGSSDQLWDAARQKGIPDAAIATLQLQGKLAHLTRNNAELVASLRPEIGSPDKLGTLVDLDLYRADAWGQRLDTLAGGDDAKLASLIPPGFEGDTAADRRDAYAADLARQVRVSYPTRVVGRMIANQELQLGAAHDPGKMVDFLASAEPLGFKLGQVPVRAFAEEHKDALFPAAPDDLAPTVESVQTLQRLYQITPSNESLGALVKLGFTSAYDIAAMSYDVFAAHYGREFPSEEEVKLVYRKAQQVSTVVYSFFTAAQQVVSAPPLFAMSPAAERRTTATDSLTKHYPEMREMFGSLDYCECEHCQSVLGPAAYLVDLLQLLDREPGEWKEFLTAWRNTHNGAAYTDSYKHPYDVLVARRPDIPHLELTCENTLTALPYIDIVNEILEYTVANDALDLGAAYDTDGATTAELLTEPQHVLAGAYDKLRAARYPLRLPFDLPLETVRSFFDALDYPFWRILDLFRQTEELEPPGGSTAPYGRAAVYAEQLRIGLDDLALPADPIASWHLAYGYATSDEALQDLSSARTLSRRLGVTYRELIELVQTQFVNPGLGGFAFLRRSGLDLVDVARYMDQGGPSAFSADEVAAFEARLDDLTGDFPGSGFDAQARVKAAWQAGDLRDVLLLRDPDMGCDFDRTTLGRAGGDAAAPIDHLRLNLFVRLWRRLGWTMAETDQALAVFLPHGVLPTEPDRIAPAVRSALLGIAHFAELMTRVKVGRNGRMKLLTLWSRIPTKGPDSLYAQLFLSAAVRKDPIFDDPNGDYLHAPDLPLHEHLPALLGALSMTADDVRAVLTASGSTLDDAKLTLDSVSLLYRHAVLAKGLSLPIRDMLALREVSGVDPFAPIPDVPITAIANDALFNGTLRFVDIAERIKASGIAIDELDYLIRHRFDPTMKQRADTDASLPLARSIASDIRAVGPGPADPSTISDDEIRTLVASVLPTTVVDTFLGMWTGTIRYEAVREGVAPADHIDPGSFASEGRIGLAYDADAQVQRLTYRGVLSVAEATRLKQEHAGNVHLPSSVHLAALLDDVHDQANDFFTAQLLRTDSTDETGFLRSGDLETLFVSPPAIRTDGTEAERQASRVANEQADRSRRTQLTAAMVPFVHDRLIRQAVVAALAAATGADPAMTEAFVTDASLLTARGGGGSLLSSFLVAATQGVDAAFHATEDASGDATASAVLTSADSRPRPDGSKIQPDGTRSARFTGYLEVPATGTYRFWVRCARQGTVVSLRIDDLPNRVLAGSAAADGGEISGAIALSAGTLHRYTLEVDRTGGGEAALLVGSDTIRKESLDRLSLTPASSVDRAVDAWFVLAKVIGLIDALDLTSAEVTALLSRGSGLGGVDLSQLPTTRVEGATPVTHALFEGYLRIADYTRLKREVAGGTDELTELFRAARRDDPTSLPGASDLERAGALLDDLGERFAFLSRRDPSVVTATAAGLGFGADGPPAGPMIAHGYLDERGVGRLWKALQLVESIGVDITTISTWARPAPDLRLASAIRDTLKARYDLEAWQRVARSVFDPLRARKRDALVAHLLHIRSLPRVEALYEQFLLDPATEPVVQTSRLRLAISSVQLFIQRCLLNLEPDVHPSAIVADHWQWMKRYRVWEANRKIFLFPENWLEPEFRDDKSHLFRELEGSLLQGDVSSDLVETAFFTYLKKLEELAHLQVVAMYADADLSDPASKILHVIGRTFNLPHKYLYRRFGHGRWTAWEPVGAEIEGDHITAAIWRSRLHLFWVTFLPKADPNAGVGPKAGDSTEVTKVTLGAVSEIVRAKRVIQMRLHWAEYFQDDWVVGESTGFDPTEVSVEASFDPINVPIAVSKEFDDGEERAVLIHLGAPLGRAFRVTSKHATPRVVSSSVAPTSPYSTTSTTATQLIGSGPVSVEFVQRVETPDAGQATKTLANPQILGAGDERFTVLPTANRVDLPNAEFGNLVSPWFYQDDQHAFFVEPALTEVTSEEWRDWVHTPPRTAGAWEADEWWAELPLVPDVPYEKVWVDALDTVDPIAKYQVLPQNDWLTAPGTVMRFGKGLIGRQGKVDLVAVAGGQGTLGTAAMVIEANPGSDAASIGALMVPEEGISTVTVAEGRAFTTGGVNVIAGGGLNASVLGSVQASRIGSAASARLMGRAGSGFLVR